MNEYMKMAKDQAEKGMKSNEGGPFGAVITDKDGNIISVANNQVLKNNDPTAHAENKSKGKLLASFSYCLHFCMCCWVIVF